MTPIDRFERELPAALTDLADPRLPDYTIDILGLTARTRQRPAWASIERWLPMDISTQRVAMAAFPWRQLGALALIAVLLAAVLAVVGSRATPKPAPIFGPAANGLIAYSLDGDIYVGDPATGESRLVLGGDAFDNEPAWSRDGMQIAFQRSPDASEDRVFKIMVMKPDGSDVRAATPEPIVAPDWWDWTPTGDIIATPSVDGMHEIVVYDSDGVDTPRTLTHGIDASAPVYRPPDSREIMFRGQVGSEVGIFVMDADGGNQRELIPRAPTGNPVADLFEPRYSPDGLQIAFQRWDDATETMRLYVMDADGGNQRELGARDGIWFTGWPVWSNDGTRIAADHATRGATGAGPYVVIDVATDSIVRTGPERPADGSRIEWAPDDSSILMSWNDGSKQVLLDPDGGPTVELPWGAASYPSWQRLTP